MKNIILLSFLMIFVFTSVSFAEVKRTEKFSEFSACLEAEEPGTFWVLSNEENIIRKLNFGTGQEMDMIELTELHKDIEAMAPDGVEGFFVATSQSRPKSQNPSDIVEVERTRVTYVPSIKDRSIEQSTLDNVRTQLENKYYFIRDVSDKNSKGGGLDIEGIAYKDRSTNTLWFGLRGPLVKIEKKDRAVLIPLNNALANGNLNTAYDWGIPIAINLNKRGIRDLYFDKDKLLILTGQMGGNPENSAPKSTLVELDLDATMDTYTDPDTGEVFRLGKVQHTQYIPQVDLKSAAEGICPVTVDGKTELLLVYDSGNEGIYQVAVRHVFYDFDGDEKADIGVYHQDAGNWYIHKSSDGKRLTFDPNKPNGPIQFGWRDTKPLQLKTIFGY